MSQKDLEEKITLELGKINGWAESLKDHASNAKINRIECKRILYDIASSVNKMIDLGRLTTPTKPPTWNDTAIKLQGLAKAIQGVGEHIENEKNWIETILRTRLFEFSHSLNRIITAADLAIRQQKGTPLLSEIGSFIANTSLNLNESWVISNCYLTAIDVTVNKRRIEFKIANPVEKKEMNIPFDQRYKELVDEMKKHDYTISEVLGPLANYFWDMRTKITHYGYVPNQTELQLITNYSKDILRMLLAKPKPKT